MSSELTIIPITDSSSGKVLKLQGKWTGNDAQILLNDGTCSWTGRFSLGDVEGDILSQLGLGRDQYLERMKTALGTTNNHDYRFTFEDDSLSWAKIVSSDFFLLHGRISLRPVAATSHGELVQSLLDSYSSVLKELSESVARYNTLEQDYKEINSAFEDCCRKKIEMENTLYTKFALILNEKKEYVRRVTGQYPTEDFGPTPSPDVREEARETIAVPCKDFLKKVKRNASATGEHPYKKPMLDPEPSSSRDYADMDT